MTLWIEYVVYGVLIFAAATLWYSFKKGKTSTELEIEMNDQSNIILDTEECSNCTPYGSWDKGGGFTVFKVRRPNKKVDIKKYHSSDLVCDPIEVLKGTYHVREKRCVPVMASFNDELEADNFEAVKKRVSSPAVDSQFEEQQGRFHKAVKDFVGGSEDDLATEPSDEEVEAAASSLKVVKAKNGREMYYNGGVMIKKSEYDRLMAEAGQ